MEFKELHNQETPLLIGNIWDVPSAEIAEKLGFQALGTSSAAIAKILGYPDGEKINFTELAYFVRQIAQRTTLPLSVDIESGYSRNPEQIVEHVKVLADLGVVGVNIEDSLVGTSRTLRDAKEFALSISTMNTILQKENIDMFINIRTDTFLLAHPGAVIETKRRITLYENAGADGIFVPCIEHPEDIKEIVKSTKLPINVMAMPNLPTFETLAHLGVKRISMGNFLFDKMYDQLELLTQNILTQKSFKSIF